MRCNYVFGVFFWLALTQQQLKHIYKIDIEEGKNGIK